MCSVKSGRIVKQIECQRAEAGDRICVRYGLTVTAEDQPENRSIDHKTLLENILRARQMNFGLRDIVACTTGEKICKQRPA